MRAARILVLLLVIVFTAVYLAPAEATLGVADREEITATALDYAEGWYTGDEVRMTRALHPDLAKRRVEAGDNGHSTLSSMTAAELSGMAGEGYGTRTPEAERQADVEIYDVMGGVATVKVTMRDWVDYMHVAKYDGRWVIVNVLWDLKPAH